MSSSLEAPLLGRQQQEEVKKKKKEAGFFLFLGPAKKPEGNVASSSSGAQFSLFAHVDRYKQASNKASLFRKTRSSHANGLVCGKHENTSSDMPNLGGGGEQIGFFSSF